MRDQDQITEDERHEAAAEEPIDKEKSKSEVEVEQRNFPLSHFPSGADGTEPGDGRARTPAAPEVEKLNEILFERLGEIVKKCCAMRVECDPEHVDYDASETNIKLFGAFSELRQMCDFYKPSEKPLDPTAPEMNDKAAKQAAYNRRTWSFCDGLFPIIHIDTPDGFMARCKINGRTFRESVVRIDFGGDKGPVFIGYIYDKDKLVTSVGGYGHGKTAVKLMTHAAFMAYVKQLSGCGKNYHNRRGFLRKNAARAMAAASE